ncbi:hypothetical protein LguiA_029083 [Lonicera macranthoides]
MDKNIGKSSSTVPEEIVFDILKELPVKTLVRFRAVSKLWCSLIDDPIFVDSHRTRSYTRIGGIRILCQYQEDFRLNIYSTDPEGGSPIRVPFHALPDGICDFDCDNDYYNRDRDSDFVDLQSVNGLVCRKYCIWNPSTRQSIDLPHIRLDMQFNVRRANQDRFCIFPINLLGFDSVSKQYKVVNMCKVVNMWDFSSEQLIRVEFRILTLGQDLYWRNLECVPENLGFRTGLGVCCVDDVIFCSGWVDDTDVIVAFEVGPEKFRVIPLPNGTDSTNIGGHMAHILQVRERMGFINVNYLKAGEANVDQLTNAKVVESLDYAEATNGDAMIGHDNDEWSTSYDIEDIVGVMNIWILEDYHKQYWKEETFTFTCLRKHKHYGIKTCTMITPHGSIRTSEILLCSQCMNLNGDSIYSCSYYDLESKSLRMVPKATESPKDYEDHENSLRFVGFNKHVECLFKLTAT